MHIAFNFDENIEEILETCMKLNIPIITFNFGNDPSKLDAIQDFFLQILQKPQIHKLRVKISVIGKWYSLPERVSEPIKEAIKQTQDYDQFFANFCVMYNGQEEIIEAAKILAMQAASGKRDPARITKMDMKENINNFIPPNIIITKEALNGFLLWDSTESKIITVEKNFGVQELLKILSQ